MTLVETLVEQRRAWDERPLVRRLYVEWFEAVAARLADADGPTVELGSGIGTFAERVPGVVRTDVERTPWTDEVVVEVGALMDQLGLTPLRLVEAGVLSHGDQRRLDLGLTLAADPAILLLDEPTAGMARSEAKDTMTQLEQVVAGRTIVLVEHDMDLVMRISKRVSVLHRGILIADGTPEEVRENPEVREAYLGHTARA